jgi:hypothetical protein
MGTCIKNLKVMDSILRDMRKHLLRNPTPTAKQLKAMLPALENIYIRTIQGICLAKLKLPSRKMARKPLLTQAMRLAFCERYINWMVDDWKVMFRDESHFELTFGNRTSLCWRPPGMDRLNLRFTRKTAKHPPKLMAWGCFSLKGRDALEWLEKGK